MATLPTPGGDAGTWGDELNEFLRVAHNEDGTLKESGSVSDPIELIFGTPDTAFEFDTSSLSGLTAVGSPDVENANTSVPGCYFIQDNAAGTALCGRYITPPSAPWTAILKIAGSSVRADHNKASIFIGVGPPGAADVLSIYNGDRTVRLERYTGPTTFGSLVVGTSYKFMGPCYLAIRCNSSSSFDYFVSLDGICWNIVATARNPSLTIGSLGFGISAENAAGMCAAFDFFRIWNSAKTFLQP